jgi:hypothetical protein
MPAYFDPTRTAIVDEINGNLLIRTDMPIRQSDSTFAYQELQTTVQRDFGAYQSLLDISVIDNVGERESLRLEANAFGVNLDETLPESFWVPWQTGYDRSQLLGSEVSYNGGQRPGNLVWWPFEGLPKNERPNVYLTSPGWDFNGLVEFLIAQALNPLPKVILFHCMLGADRTGALHRGYLMKAKKMHYNQACDVADASCQAGHPNQDYDRLSKAYFSFLKPPAPVVVAKSPFKRA